MDEHVRSNFNYLMRRHASNIENMEAVDVYEVYSVHTI
jgi:hypothetical protein